MAKTPKTVTLPAVPADPETALPALEETVVPDELAEVFEAMFKPDTTALDAALTRARTLHIDSSTDEGRATLYVRNALVEVVDELRALLLQR
jgi:hypothetical protein